MNLAMSTFRRFAASIAKNARDIFLSAFLERKKNFTESAENMRLRSRSVIDIFPEYGRAAAPVRAEKALQTSPENPCSGPTNSIEEDAKKSATYGFRKHSVLGAVVKENTAQGIIRHK